jgi:hypothetical protein
MSALPAAPAPALTPAEQAERIGAAADFYAVLAARERLVSRVERGGGTIADGLIAVNPQAAELAVLELQRRKPGVDPEAAGQTAVYILSGLALGAEVIDDQRNTQLDTAFGYAVESEAELLGRASELLDKLEQTDAVVEVRQLIDDRFVREANINYAELIAKVTAITESQALALLPLALIRGAARFRHMQALTARHAADELS